jgi:hypothetical protein
MLRIPVRPRQANFLELCGLPAQLTRLPLQNLVAYELVA